jgi:hypothetical protein
MLHVPALGKDLPTLMDLVPAGAIGGLASWASYRAAREGSLPTLRLGSARMKVPTAAWLDKLGLADEAVNPAGSRGVDVRDRAG